MAIGHYQFEAIHPFTDGNGRTGRILNLLFLVEQELLSAPVLYLSGALIRRKSDYYRRLLAVTTEAAWEPWLLFMLDAVTTTARWTTEITRRIRAMLDSTAATVRQNDAGLSSRELVELLFVQPYCRISNVVEASLAQRQTASEYLRRLCKIGVLEEVRTGREKLFINAPLLALLTKGREP